MLRRGVPRLLPQSVLGLCKLNSLEGDFRLQRNHPLLCCDAVSRVLQTLVTASNDLLSCLPCPAVTCFGALDADALQLIPLPV